MASVKILLEGKLSTENNGKTAPTVSLIRDENIAMVVDPGFLGDKREIIEALKKEGLGVEDVNIVCVTHSHIDHYANAGMFFNAKVLEYFGLWDKDGKMEDWKEDFSENVKIIKTPGHDDTSITLFVKTEEGTVAVCGDVFWKKGYPEPEEDIFASNIEKLKHSRKLVLQIADWIVPGHGGMFKAENGRKSMATIQSKDGQKKKVEALGKCKKCRRQFTKASDRCFCQEWLCYHCCECEPDCNTCNCKHRI